jgi:hypothetical protein
MNLKTAMGLEGDVSHLDTKPPEGSNVKSSFAVEATIENIPQELKKIRNFTALKLSIPGSLSTEAAKVLEALFDCFEKAGTVQEGLIADMIWGFQQVNPPIDGQVTVAGLLRLQKEGYIRFQSRDNEYTEMTKNNIGHLFVRYQPKLLDMVYEKTV